MEHDEEINCLYLLEDGKIVSASYDGNVKHYNPIELSVICKVNINKKNEKLTYITQLKDRTVIIGSNRSTYIFYNKLIIIFIYKIKLFR